MKNNSFYFVGMVVIIFQIASLTQFTKAQNLSTQWGGQGVINMETPVVRTGQTVRFQYSIINSRGTAASINCIVVSPVGRVTIQHKSFNMSNGSGSTTFEVQAGEEEGGYIVFCYWYINGYGVDGPTCLAYSIFKVR